MEDYIRHTVPLIEKELREYFRKDADLSWLVLRLGKVSYDFDVSVWGPVCSAPFYDLFDRGGENVSGRCLPDA
jgi:hypothetical protein